jgi:hypothetical protein
MALGEEVDVEGFTGGDLGAARSGFDHGVRDGFVAGREVGGFVRQSSVFGSGLRGLGIGSADEGGVEFGEGERDGVLGGGNGLAEDDEVADEAGVEAMEAGLVALENGHLGTGGELAEGAGEAVEFVGSGRAGVHFVVHHIHLDGEGAAGAPVGGDHFLDEAAFDLVDGLEAVVVGLEHGLVGFLVFVAQDDDVGLESVFGGVLGGTGLTFGSNADSEGWRSAFRTDVDHDSEVMPISVPN